MRLLGKSLIISAFLPVSALAGWDDLPDCSPTMRRSDQCVVDVSQLYPTQFALGLILVREKENKISRMDRKERHDYLMDHPVPVVIGPGGKFFQIDHHHLARALDDLGFSGAVAEILANWRDLSVNEFWGQMIQKHWVYLIDENGDGPLSPADLPRSVREMRDDPYRSLASAVHDEGCFRKTSIPFAEFQWAEFFRARVGIKQGEEGFKQAIREALPYCHSPEAKGLPGYEP